MNKGDHLLSLARMAEEIGISLGDARDCVKSLRLPYEFALNRVPYWTVAAMHHIQAEAIRRGIIPETRVSEQAYEFAMAGLSTIGEPIPGEK